jgi:hypothetical protein
VIKVTSWKKYQERHMKINHTTYEILISKNKNQQAMASCTVQAQDYNQVGSRES